MKTPSGIDCPYFFGDYYRGKNVEECRLFSMKTSKDSWNRNLCKRCPVPEIKRANGCPNMVLSPTIKKGLFGITNYVKISAFCEKSQKTVITPEIGCGQCHPISNIFWENRKS